MRAQSVIPFRRILSSINRRMCCAALVACCLCSTGRMTGQSAAYAQAEALVRNHQWDEGLAEVLRLLKSDPRNIRELNLAGLALTGKGDIPQANEYFRKVLLIAPGFVPALKNLAINEFNQKRYDDAEKHLLTASKDAPNDPIIHLYLGEAAYRQHDFQLSAEALSRSPDFVHSNASVAAHLATSYLELGQQENAFKILDTLGAAPIDPPSQFALGVALLRHGLAERSIPYLEAVRLLYPDSYDIGFDLALGYLGTKQFPKAIQEAKDLIARGHDTSELNNLLGEAYEADNQVQNAVDALRRAIALDPADENNYLDFASLCMNQRSLQAGLTVIQVGLESHPKSDRLIFMRGVLHATQDEFEMAEKDFRLAADLSPQNNLGYVGLGVSYLETGHDAQAIEILHRRLKENPNDASLLYLLGEALIRSGAAAGSPAQIEAQTSLEKSVRLNPNLCLPHVSLGTLYLDEDRPSDAVEQFEKARAIDPKERSAYSHLAVAYRRIGQIDKSKEVLNNLKQVIEQERQSTREKMKTTQSAAGVDESKDRKQ